MAFRIPSIRKASLSASKGTNVPKGYLAVYVGDKMRRFLIPVYYLNQPLFRELLSQSEEEFGYDHPTGGLTIPCSEDAFLNLTCQLSGHLLQHEIHRQFKREVICWKTSSLQGIYETGITNRFCFSPTYTARCPFGTSTDLEAAWLAENDDVLRITGIRRATKNNDVPKGYLAVYVGDKMKRILIPISYLNQPLFQELLNQAEEEFGYDHPNGGLTIPCGEDEFLNLTSQLSRL
ncbi:hypothetical protein AHAS_Ahas03G0056100 [Arachis hypogaea]